MRRSLKGERDVTEMIKRVKAKARNAVFIGKVSAVFPSRRLKAQLLGLPLDIAWISEWLRGAVDFFFSSLSRVLLDLIMLNNQKEF